MTLWVSKLWSTLLLESFCFPSIVTNYMSDSANKTWYLPLLIYCLSKEQDLSAVTWRTQKLYLIKLSTCPWNVCSWDLFLTKNWTKCVQKCSFGLLFPPLCLLHELLEVKNARTMSTIFANLWLYKVKINMTDYS